jgi:colanic acid/amylovoran biosynthesis glycosyltransferase
MSEAALDPRPHVISLCGTYLKPEMQSIYRQIVGLRAVRTTVYAQWLEHRALFPFEPLTLLTKLHHRPKGNFLLRFWYKYVVKQWPPPVAVNRYQGPCHPWDLIDHLRRDKPDLVHAYYGHKAAGYLPMLKEWAGPFVVSFHGVDVAKDVDKPEHLATLRETMDRAELVMARSQSLLQRVAELGCPPDKLRLNRTPIPMDHLSPTVRQAPTDGQWRLVQACRLIAKKGLLTTLEALQLLVPRYPGLRFTICGTGPLEGKLREAIAARGLGENVVLAGWQSQSELLALYQSAHVFLHPSELTKESDQEGIPNSMLEAMATGLPIVATRHGGIPEAVTDGLDGLLVAERSPAELAQAIEALLTNGALLATLSRGAAESVRANFEAGRQLQQMEAVYAEAIELYRRRMAKPL